MAHHQQHVVLPLVRVEAGDEASFQAHKGTLPFTIAGPMPSSMSSGQEWTLVGSFDGTSQTLKLEQSFEAPGRKGKKLLGVVGLGLGVFLLPMAVSFKREGWSLVIRG